MRAKCEITVLGSCSVYRKRKCGFNARSSPYGRITSATFKIPFLLTLVNNLDMVEETDPKFVKLIDTSTWRIPSIIISTFNFVVHFLMATNICLPGRLLDTAWNWTYEQASLLVSISTLGFGMYCWCWSAELFLEGMNAWVIVASLLLRNFKLMRRSFKGNKSELGTVLNKHRNSAVLGLTITILDYKRLLTFTPVLLDK